jgi:hypothetical protein
VGFLPMHNIQRRLIMNRILLLLLVCCSVFRTRGEHPLDIYWDRSFIADFDVDSVKAIAVTPDGNTVFVGGDFLHFKQPGHEYLVRGVWDGQSWTWESLGSGVNGPVYALSVNSANSVVIGGSFNQAGGITANNIVRATRNASGVWNYSPLIHPYGGANGVTGGPVYAIVDAGSDGLWVGGAFTSAGGNQYSARFARYTTAGWSQAVCNVNGTVHALALYGSSIVVGGEFTSVQSSAPNGASGYVSKLASRLAIWNPSYQQWSVPGGSTSNPGVDGPVYALAVSGSSIYVGGSFQSAGTVAAERIVRWNGASSWTTLDGGVTGVDDEVCSIRIIGSDVFVGGRISQAGPANNPIKVCAIARWRSGDGWLPLGEAFRYAGEPGDRRINAMATTVRNVGSSKEYNVFVGGKFNFRGYGTLIARWRVQLIDLGVLPGTSFSEAYGLNDGYDNDGDGFDDLKIAGSSGNSAFLWTENTDGLGGTMALIPTPSTGGTPSFMTARDVNNAGRVVGGMYFYSNNQAHSFVWDEGALSSLRLIDTFQSSVHDITDDDIIVGTHSDGGLIHATVWSPITLAYQNVSRGSAYAGNSIGDIVGSFDGAALWESFSFKLVEDTELGWAFGVNDQRDMVGASGGQAILLKEALLPHIELGSIYGTSEAKCINNNGLIVGNSPNSSGPASPRAMIATYEVVDDEGVTRMYDLNRILLSSWNFTLSEARRVNSGGSIVGKGLNSTLNTRGYLLRK